MLKRMILLVVALLSGFLVACGSPSGAVQQPARTQVSNGGPVMVLIFSKTAGYRHASIKDGIVAIRKLASEHTIHVDFTEDSSAFSDQNLARYKAVVFLSTTGNILNAEQKAAFERYIHAGGGYAGIHSATDTEYDWAWYGRLVGAYFKSHPHISHATINVEDQRHSSTSMLPKRWERTDEWYNFRTNPRGSVHILLTLDESSYQGGEMGKDHPIAWYHEFEGGRAWYTALGHTSESFSEPLFLAHLWGGIAYAAGLGSK